MSSRREFLGGSLALAQLPDHALSGAVPTEREYWAALLTRICDPVLTALSQRKLKATMPVEAPHGNIADRRLYTHLEALGRTLAGLAPWLETGHAGGRLASLAREAVAAAVDPASPDFLNFNQGLQPVVDAAFLALALLRAPVELWEKLGAATKSQLLAALRSSRAIRPGFNNWLLFSATIEAFFCRAGEDWDAMRIDYAVRQHEQWYKGDGVYSDGPQLHWDYYNSYVIHPMLLAVLDAVKGWAEFQPPILERAKRYAAIQERLIAPDGSFPPVGRSITYRCGAFHHLADMALRRELPDSLPAAQVRTALSAAVHKTMEAPGTFNPDGWLNVGLCGHQPAIAEAYISTGSLYLCTTAFLPLGLPADDPFWFGADLPRTSQRVWNGEDVAPDHALAPQF